MNSLQELVKEIQAKIGYKIVGKEWGRLGAIVKRYGKNAVVKTIEDMAKWSFKPNPFIDTLEKQCQKNVSTKESKIDEEIEKLL